VRLDALFTLDTFTARPERARAVRSSKCVQHDNRAQNPKNLELTAKMEVPHCPALSAVAYSDPVAGPPVPAVSPARPEQPRAGGAQFRHRRHKSRMESRAGLAAADEHQKVPPSSHNIAQPVSEP